MSREADATRRGASARRVAHPARRAALSARRCGGVTLIELVVAILVVAIALSGTMLLVDTTTRRSADPMLERQAVSIAEAYLEEIALKDFIDPDTGTLCPAPEASRSLYDNVCDYDGLDDDGARDQSGNAITGLDDYRIEIDVDTTANLGAVSGSADVVRIDAVVTDPQGRTVVVSHYRTSA